MTTPQSSADPSRGLAIVPDTFAPIPTDVGDACIEGCITCGDIAVEVVVTSLLPAAMAVVDTAAGAEEVSVALVDARVGDTVLVHAGEAIAVLRR